MNENRDDQNTSIDSEGIVLPEVKTAKIKKGFWRTYDSTDGLPGAPERLLQDRKGYLWIGTHSGLCRYDGTEFISYTIADGLVNNDARRLCEDNRGRLWVGTAAGISCFDGKEFTSYTTSDGLIDNEIAAICLDEQNSLWIGTTKGISCFDGERFTNYTISDGLLDNYINSLCPGHQEGIWIGTKGGISRLVNSQITTLTADIVADGPALSMWEDRKGRLWIATGYQAKGVYCFDGEEFRNYGYKDGLVDKQNLVTVVYEDMNGRMWFGGWGNISCLGGDNFVHYEPTDYGLPSSGVFDIIEDREGQMWFAHGQFGLSCYDPEVISLLSEQGAGWISTQDRDGRIWFGNWDLYGLSIDPGLSETQTRRIPANGAVVFAMVDSRERLWFVPYHDGLYCYESTQEAWEAAGGKELPEPVHFVASEDSIDKDIIPTLEMRDGTIWFLFIDKFRRISRFQPDEPIDGEPLETIEDEDAAAFMIEDSQGRLWMGGPRSIYLSCWDGDKLTKYNQENGLPYGGIRTLLEDDDGRIWAGTRQGLYCFDGKNFVTYGEEHDLRDLIHWCSAKDSSGQLWFATTSGIYRTDGEHFQWLTEDDGLPDNCVSGLMPQSDGSMIIGTSKGFIHYNPTATFAPPVEIQEVVADRIYRKQAQLELTTTQADLITISYHGLSLSTRRMRYSYILEGYDGKEEWAETWNTQARYENLPVGEYTFKVIAINRDLFTSESPAILKLTVIPDPRDAMVTELKSDLEVKNQQLKLLKREMEQKYRFEDIIGESEAIRFVRAQMSQVIDRDMNILITGETGTGKELVARGIHRKSSRKDRILLPYNCGAIPRDLVASELFGHRKGAFTGANEDKMGLFEIASGGTVILDEIGDMPIDIQPSLLRVLQERKFQRLGEGEYEFRELDVCIVSITNRDILQEIKAGRFRRDLYYRLNGFHIFVPPLRERRDDIPLLAEHFYQEAFQKQRKELDGFAPEALDMLINHTWPGNVRELQTEIERACMLAQKGSPIQSYHFSPEITGGESLSQEIMSERLSYKESVMKFRRQLIERALQECDGNRTQAARLLGMGRSNLLHLIKDLNLDV